jgi:hypothetical protein
MFNDNRMQWVKWGRNGVLTLFLFWFVLVIFIHTGSWWNFFLVPVMFPIPLIQYFFPNFVLNIVWHISPLMAAFVAIIIYFFLGVIVGYLNSKLRNKSRVLMVCFLIFVLFLIFYILPH